MKNKINPVNSLLIFIGVSFIPIIIGIYLKNYLWFIRAGIFLIAGIVYYFLLKNYEVKNRKWVKKRR